MQGAIPSDGLFVLPGGLILDDGWRLSHAELRPLTGNEEVWLAGHPATPSALVVTRLLSSCLIQLDDMPGSPALVRRLIVGDREYLMLQLRRMTLGNTIQAVFVCPACQSKMDVDFKEDEIPVERRPQTAASYTLNLVGADGAERKVCFRLPTGADQEAGLNLDSEQAVASLLARCIIDDGGRPLGLNEQAAVIDEMERVAPQLELELELSCPECDHSFLAPFDMTAFFFAEIRINADQLLREVHHLALHYHWSEAEILGLTRTRRRAYLALLNEALPQE